MQAYQELVDNAREQSLLSRSAAVLGWDQETYLPPAAIGFRADQLSYLSGKVHQLATLPAIADWLDQAQNEVEENSREAANLREWRFHYERATRLPRELIERESRTNSLAKAAWVEARQKNDFSQFAPHLEATLEINREKADRFGYEDEAYDALLCGFERGARTAEVADLLEQLMTPLAALAHEVIDKQSEVPAPVSGHFPVQQQERFNREIAESLGFDFESGRIDTTTHPFCTTLGPKDVRLTTRYDEGDFASSLFGVMHEAGHGLYEQGLPADQWGLPCGSSVSLGIHESQSRLWENHLGRSRIFWEHWLPRAKEIFSDLRKHDVDSLLATLNRPAFSFIRVEADELTYDLHIILRFQLERQLLNGEIKVSELPDAWNSLFKELFELEVPDPARGCLQDIHWSMGAIGYFATYTLGNINAAQLFAAANEDSSVRDGIATGDYLPLRNWMRREVHSHGARYLPKELIQRATGKAPSIDHYLAHLRSRYASAG